MLILKKSKCVGTSYLRYKEDYLASEIDCKKNLRQRTQVLIRRRNSNEVASVLCFSMLVTWKALQKPGKMEVARSMALVEVIRKNVILVIKKSELFFSPNFVTLLFMTSLSWVGPVAYIEMVKLS